MLLPRRIHSSNEIVNSLWIAGDLGTTQQLTVRSFQEYGHHFVLWSYVDLKVDCELRDAREVLPESSIFFYKNMPQNYRFGGIAERLKAELLYRFGGWHVDMDVTCLRHFNFNDKYVFKPLRHHDVTGNIIKAPSQCSFARDYRDWTATINEWNTDWERSLRALGWLSQKHELNKYIVPISVFGNDVCIDDIRSFVANDGGSPDSERYAIHWAETGRHTDYWRQRSFYASLLKRYNLI